MMIIAAEWSCNDDNSNDDSKKSNTTADTDND